MVGFFVSMKNLTKNWVAIAAVVLVVLIGGYFVSGNYQQGDNSAVNTEQDQKVESQVTLTVDYAGDVAKETEVKTVTIEESDTAWEVLRETLGEENIEFTDYGGDLGVFVTGINGVTPSGSKFWLFKINGNGADVGPSSYKVQNGDKIEFKISEPVEGV